MHLKNKKLLIIANHRFDRSPGQRFRYEQYLTYLSENGYDFTLSNIISEKQDKVLYSKGKYLQKLLIALNSWLIRLKDILRANDFDVILIYREALLTRSVFFENRFSKSTAKVIFDFDDAIWLPNVSAGNKSLQILKNPNKTDRIISCADMVFAGNAFLAKYASKFSNNIKIIPTTIDTSYHKPSKQRKLNKVCVGWTGTQTTMKYLEELLPVFQLLKQKYQDKVTFKIICDTPWIVPGLEIENVKWSRAEEISQLDDIDIGVMPLTEDDWSKGKCGFKGLQYMAMESAAILSPVGVNTEIIEHQKNGFLVETTEEWIRTLSLLIEDENLRKRVGKEARKTIEEKYSVNAFKTVYLNYFNELTEQ